MRGRNSKLEKERKREKERDSERERENRVSVYGEGGV